MARSPRPAPTLQAASVFPNDAFWDDDVYDESTGKEHLLFFARCAAALLGQNLIWLGMYDLLENYGSAGSIGYG